MKFEHRLQHIQQVWYLQKLELRDKEKRVKKYTKFIFLVEILLLTGTLAKAGIVVGTLICE